MQHVILTLVVFALAFAGLAIGVIVQGQRRELKGSCGGVGANPDCCMTCPEKDHCDAAHEAHHAQAEAEVLVPLAQAPSGQTAVRPF